MNYLIVGDSPSANPDYVVLAFRAKTEGAPEFLAAGFENVSLFLDF